MGKSKASFGPDPADDPPPPASEPPLPVNPVVAAAQEAVASLFDTLAADWPKLLQPPTTGGPIPALTADMIQMMRDNLRRALGLKLDPPQ
jgi:hypothetical protein